jgi:hypothetical protein
MGWIRIKFERVLGKRGQTVTPWMLSCWAYGISPGDRPITIRRACAVPCTSARTRGVRKAETSDERGEWIVKSAGTWRKRKQEPSDERVKGEGHVGLYQSCFFLFINGI